VEKGESGTVHLQGYLELGVPKRLKAIKQIPGLEKAHFERRLGTREQARDYCRKADSRERGPFEHGNWDVGGQGRRSDLASVVESVKAGKTLKEVSEEFPTQMIKYHRGITVLRNLTLGTRNWKSMVTLLYGAPGVGKSHWCSVSTEEKSVCWLPALKRDAVWFDGYDGQEILIVDDYRGEIEFSMLLRLLDKFPLQVPVKGGFSQMLAKEIWITTNMDPRSWYNYSESKPISALVRRIEKFLVFRAFKEYLLCNDYEHFCASVDELSLV